MHIDSLAIYATLAAFVVAMLLCGLLIVACIKCNGLLLRARKISTEKSSRIAFLQNEINQLQQAHETAASASSSHFDIQEQLEQTQARHQELHGDPALHEHLQPAATLPLRVAALRHCVLSAEIEASLHAEQRWRTLDIKLGTLLKQISSAEKSAIPDLTAITPEPAVNTELMGELQRLRDVTSSQKDQITELEARLGQVNSHEEKDALLADMQKQLAQLTRYMHEADTCIQQVEEELTATCNQLQEISEEHKQIKSYGGELEILIRDFSTQSRDMLQSIAILENENRSLRNDESNSPILMPPTTDSTENNSQTITH